MLTSPSKQEIQTLELVKDIEIAAPMDIVFETILEQLAQLNAGPDGTAIPMKLEAWPGGRWYRDLGNNRGHLWGFVQSIRPHDLLEIQGPLFMSAPATSHLLYRLKEQAGATHIQFSHRAIGLIPAPLLDGADVNRGWTNHLARVSELAERKTSSRA